MNHTVEDIWQQFNRKILNFIKSRVDNTQEAEDILQDVFLKIHINIEGLKSGEKIPAWIYRITRNTITDYYREKGRKSFIKFDELIYPPEDESKSPGNNDIAACLDSFMKILPEKYKATLELDGVRGMKQKHIAENLNISLSAVKSRIKRGRQMIKQHFIDCCKFVQGPNGKLAGGDWPDENCSTCDVCSSRV